ncbi:Cadherin-related family member 1 [Larimichthys crocea]|uniref:Uncharacterized protein n=1 Tax=Larimichthys crocea TaxID=215358 RepID=A0ACD3RRP9_LARCR|nr:Cadherin-related family member 1 [Larimichthys crocea]
MYLRRRLDACCSISDFSHQGFSSKARFGFRRGKTTRDQLKEAAFEPATDTAIKIDSMGRIFLAGGAAVGLGALCYYGLGMSNEIGAIEKAVIWPQYVKDRIHSTYLYFAGSVGMTALSAVAVSRTPVLMGMMMRGSWLAIGATFAAMIGAGMLVRSISYEHSPVPKHLAWMLHAGVMGAVIAPLTLLGGPLMMRAAWYTAGIVGGSMFLPPTSAFGAGLYSVAIYGGLVLFSMFLLYDTQKVVKRAETHPLYGVQKYDPINAALATDANICKYTGASLKRVHVAHAAAGGVSISQIMFTIRSHLRRYQTPNKVLRSIKCHEAFDLTAIIAAQPNVYVVTCVTKVFPEESGAIAVWLKDVCGGKGCVTGLVPENLSQPLPPELLRRLQKGTTLTACYPPPPSLPHEPAKPYLPTRMKKEKKTHALLFLLLLHFTSGQSDYAPYFYDNGPSSTNGNMALFSISEDTPVGTQVYILNGTDPEGDPVRYGLTFEQGSKEFFRADSKSGNVTLIQELDREKQGEISVLVSITDGRNKVVETVRVFVTDANDEPPEFQNLPFIIDIPEDTAPGSSIYRVQALDKDMGSGGSVSYYLQVTMMQLHYYADDAQLPLQFAKFTIDGHSGILRVKPGETLDYETTPTHFVTVVAKDGGGKYKGKHQVLTSTATITINLIDAQDMPPSFVGTPYFGYVYEVSVPGSEIFTVYAKDGDQGKPNMMHYSIMNGSDGVFDINSTSGCITLTTYPFLLRNELYEIKVKASELGPNDQLQDYDVTTVTVRVVDLNNHPPTFYGESGPQSKFEVTMYEHPPAGEILRGFKITVNDSDQGANAKFKLRLVGPNRVLRVVPQTVLNEAQVTIIVEDTSGIDYEKGPTLSFKLLAVEIDTPERFSATADIVINLLDTNDNVPKFTAEYYIARVPENSPGGSSVVSVTANDPDSGPWGLPSTHQSGLISTQPWTSLDAEVRSKYNFYIKAEDSEGKYSLSEAFVTVVDMNDHPPEFDEELLEKTMIIGTPVKVEAMDDDAESPNNVIQYSIMTADPDNAFDINADTGEIKLKPYIKSMEIVNNITKQKDCKWSLVVQARDRGSPSFSTTAVVNIDITEATPLKGPMAAFLLKSRDNPMKALGMVTVIITVLVGVTALISTAMYMRNSKSNRIMPARRIIKRRPRDQKPWDFRMPLIKFNDPADKFIIGDPESRLKRGSGSSRPKPPPPSAPSLPPPPPTTRPNERPRAVPTISGALASKVAKTTKSRSPQRRAGKHELCFSVRA